jgi:hypothetical protein
VTRVQTRTSATALSPHDRVSETFRYSPLSVTSVRFAGPASSAGVAARRRQSAIGGWAAASLACGIAQELMLRRDVRYMPPDFEQ